ncbi:MAG: ChbG/HpnK family deacetylase [Endomicrobia bacterium]|nr:ChbG/HpnK family deacetylase [Endomicrobiia bacterium]
MESAKKIIVNADDFGYRKNVNEGIIFAHKNGIVKSASVLTDRDAFEDAVFLSKENPGLKTGLHIDLDTFIDVNKDVADLMSVASFKTPKPDKQQIIDAIDRQLDKFLNAGFKLSHLDGHHHAHMHPEILPFVAQKAKEFNVPVRFFEWFYNDFNLAQQMKQILIDLNIKFCPHFINGWYWGNVDENFQLAELMTHPGFNEMWREFETAKCCDPVLKNYLDKNNIEIISFEDI